MLWLAALPPGETRYPLNRRLGGPQELSGWVRKISPPPGFYPWTVQHVASCYSDCVIPAIYVPDRNSFCLNAALDNPWKFLVREIKNVKLRYKVIRYPFYVL